MRGLVALLVCAIGITAFDGGSEGPRVQLGRARPAGLLQLARRGHGARARADVRASGSRSPCCWWRRSTGARSRAWGERGLRRPLSRGELGRALAHTLVPIAAAYVVAHYFSLLAYNGQDIWRLASDPLGDGSDLFGGADAGIDYSVVSATAIWYVQVGALVIGHVAALVLGHDRALALYE